jgi:cytochrome c553
MFRLRLLTNKSLIVFLFSLVFIFQSFNFALANECPQKRKTVTAPKDYLGKISPLRNEPRFIKKGKVLSHIKAKPIACKQCHGMSGKGDGSMSPNLNPKPRNFTCESTMDQISDGQLFWIIKNGSKGTAMPAYSRLSDQKIWQLIQYIRSLSKEVS